MKMPLLRYSAAVICAVFILTGAVSGEHVKKAVGGTVSFRPAKLDPPVTSITWKHKTNPAVKAIEWDFEDGLLIPNQRFKDITTLDEKTGEITITKLRIEHSGNYTIDINSKEQEQRFSLEVIERVPKPKITIEKSGNPDVVYVRCAYSGTIIWKNSTGETLKGTKNHTPGEFITVHNTRNPENYYNCTLKNAVSEETSDRIYESELFVAESNAGLIAGMIAFILILILIIIGLIGIYLLKESVYKSVNERCPCIKSVLSCVDCCEKKREQYNPASKINFQDDEMNRSTGGEMKEGAVSTDQNNVTKESWFRSNTES